MKRHSTLCPGSLTVRVQAVCESSVRRGECERAAAGAERSVLSLWNADASLNAQQTRIHQGPSARYSNMHVADLNYFVN